MTEGELQPDTWIELYAESLYLYAAARVRNPDIAEDLVQETFLAALRGSANFQGKSTVLTWLTAILKHKIQDHFRTKWRETSMTDLSASSPADAAPAQFDMEGHWLPNQPGRWPEPASHLDQQDFIRTLHRCLDRMPKRLASAFILREMEELPSKEVCDILGVTDQNYWAMMHRARGLLRTCIEENWFMRKDAK